MKTGITPEVVIKINETALIQYGGLSGVNIEKLEGALGRIDKQFYYNGLEDTFDIAAWYLVAIAKGHAFNDGNKRTALIVALTFLSTQGLDIPSDCGLDDFMVGVAESHEDHENLVPEVADRLYEVAMKYNDLPETEDEPPLEDEDIA